MKLKISMIIITTCFIITTFQNLANAFEFGLGPKLGLGVGFATGDDWFEQLDANHLDNRVLFSFSIGFLLEMNFYQGDVSGIGIQPEILYTRTGDGRTKNDDNYAYNSYNTIQFPIYIKPRFKIGSGFLVILLGPDFLLSASNITSTVIAGGNEFEIDYAPDNEYCIGLGSGIGYDMELGPGRLQIGFTYTKYFTGFINNYDKFNNMVHLNVAYSFMLVK